jgi:hypothetical protein
MHNTNQTNWPIEILEPLIQDYNLVVGDVVQTLDSARHRNSRARLIWKQENC